MGLWRPGFVCKACVPRVRTYTKAGLSRGRLITFFCVFLFYSFAGNCFSMESDPGKKKDFRLQHLPRIASCAYIVCFLTCLCSEVSHSMCLNTLRLKACIVYERTRGTLDLYNF